MSTAAQQAAELRAQAATLDDLGKLERKAADAKASYQGDRSDEKLKARHQAAAKALADARQLLRPQPATEDGDAVVAPQPVNGTATPGKVA